MMRRFAVLLVLVMVVAACNGDATPSAGESGNGGASGDTSDETTLAGFLGWDADATDWRDQETRVQEAIRVCMANEGFEYKPVVPPAEMFEVREFDEAEEVSRRGFGITTWVTDDGSDNDPGMEWEDPNQAALDAMSEAEQRAWNEALHGTEDEQMEQVTIEVDPETGEETWMQEGYGPGCYGEASQEVYGDLNRPEIEDLWMQLEPAFEAMYQQVQADPRVVELDEEWAACMTGKGHQVTTMNDFHMNVYEDFQQRLDVILGDDYWGGDPTEGMSEEEMNEFWQQPAADIDAALREWEQERLERVDRDALEALQQEEIALAVDEFECRGEFSEIMQKVSEEYEADFIEENRALLTQLRDAEQG